MPLKLFLDIVRSFSADVTGTLCAGCFRSLSVYVVSLRFVSKQSKTSNAAGMSFFDSLITISKGASVLGMF